MSVWDFWTKPKTIKALKLSLDAALKVLETTGDVLNTTPIPGAAAAITVILDVVKRQERANKNAELTTEQQERWRNLVSELGECATQSESTLIDSLPGLQEASQALRNRLQEYAQKLEEETTHMYRPRWMTCGGDEEALQDFLRKSNQAFEDYRRAQGNRIEDYVTDIRYRLLFDTLPRARLAAYNAPRRVGTLSSCADGTRVSLLKTITKWRKKPGTDRVFWLKERAGFGKTAIALSIAEQAANEGTLAASFFFSYQIPELNTTLHFLPTIIYQLCLFGGTPYKKRFGAAIAKHGDVLDARLKDQAQKLFLDPLKTFPRAPTGPPAIIVVDALDECRHDDAQELTAFIASLLSLDLPFKIFITSRPELQITAPFSDFGIESRIIEDTSTEDVETYLCAELAMIPSKPGIRDLKLPRDWITEEEIQGLLERAGAMQVSDSGGTEKGLFVYVATVLRFIGDKESCDPQKHVRILLSTAPSVSSTRPYQGLDDLYTHVLDVALKGRDDLQHRFRMVVGGIMAVVRDEEQKAEAEAALKATAEARAGAEAEVRKRKLHEKRLQRLLQRLRQQQEHEWQRPREEWRTEEQEQQRRERRQWWKEAQEEWRQELQELRQPEELQEPPQQVLKALQKLLELLQEPLRLEWKQDMQLQLQLQELKEALERALGRVAQAVQEAQELARLKAEVRARAEARARMVILSTLAFETLLGLPPGEVRRTLVNLQSVVQYLDHDSTLPSFHHRSFADFLTDEARSGSQYYIELKPQRKFSAVRCLQVIATSPLKAEVTSAMNQQDYFFYPETNFSCEFWHASYYLSNYFKSIQGDSDLLDELEKFIKADFSWWIEFFPHIAAVGLCKISNAVDPEDKQDLPILFRALADSQVSFSVDDMFPVHSLVRKELRRYISMVTQRQDDDPQKEAPAAITSFKERIYELRERTDRAGKDDKRTCMAILAFAKDAEAVLDEYQLSIGNQEEIERSRKRTLFLRRQVRPLLEKNKDLLGIAADGLEAFEQEGIWTLEST